MWLEGWQQSGKTAWVYAKENKQPLYRSTCANTPINPSSKEMKIEKGK